MRATTSWQCVLERLVLLPDCLHVHVDALGHRSEPESHVVAWPYLVHKPSNAWQLIANWSLMTRHHAKFATHAQIIGIGDGVLQVAVLGFAIAIRDVMRVNVLAPWALLALLACHSFLPIISTLSN
jgi:hypothetical protein